MKKKLIHNKKEYREFVFRMLNAKNIDIWEGFDEKILNIAFDFFRRNNLKENPNKEQRLAIDYYLKMSESQDVKERFYLKNSTDGINESYLEEAFGVIRQHDCYDTDENGKDIDENGNVYPDDFSSPDKLVFEDWVNELTFPLILVYWIESSFDRIGDCSVCSVEFIEEKDWPKNSELQRILELAEECAFWHICDSDECGEIARELLNLINKQQNGQNE